MVFGRGGFWRIQEPPPRKSGSSTRRIAVIIPARNEEPVVGSAVASLLSQDYLGELHVVVVDDQSSDGTAVAVARAANARVTVISAGALPPGWTGKLWAISEGLKVAEPLKPDYFLFTDADIVHAPDNLRNLVARAEADSLDLASLMVKLHCRSLAERTLIPAFVYFFFQLYPPRWIASPRRSTAGAAGGCMLIRPEALRKIGGIEAIRSELIDDCALASCIKEQGDRVWLGTTATTHSVRAYAGFSEIESMIARTAFTQLRYSTSLLVATVLGMAIIYLAPPFLVLTGDRLAVMLGGAAWLLMTISYLPVLRFYRQPLAGALLLPVIALFYMFATVDSAVRHWAGCGGGWKGRIQSAR